MTVDEIETWLAACEELLASEETEGNKEAQIRHWVGTAAAHVGEILEWSSRHTR